MYIGGTGIASYPGFPMFFNVSREKSRFSRETLKNMGKPGYEARTGIYWGKGSICHANLKMH